MSRVNIGKHVKDDHYRYTMEPLQLKIEGRGNGIKTILVNVANTAVDLKVPPMYITKYFGYELGAQATHDAKNDKFIVNGAFDNHTTDKLLDDFISKFVLCPKCKLPEIDLIVDTKTENIGMNCKACGNQSKVSPKEKLHKFILTHPPPKPKPLKKPPAGTQEDTTETKPTVKAATSVSASDESWSSDLSEEAVKKRRAEELVASKMLGNQEEESDEEKEELGEKSPTQVLKEYLELKPESTDAATIKVVQKIKSDYGLRSKDVICLLFEALYETKDILKEIPKRAKVFKTFLKEMKVPQQGQATIIGYLEDLVFNNKELLKQLPKICEALYDADVVSEEVFVAWHAEKKSKYVKDAEALKKIKDAAAPFITWLQEASDDDEEEEDDE